MSSKKSLDQQPQPSSDGVIIEMSATTTTTTTSTTNYTSLVPLYSADNIITVEEGSHSPSAGAAVGSSGSALLEVSTITVDHHHGPPPPVLPAPDISRYDAAYSHTYSPYYYETSGQQPYTAPPYSPTNEQYVNSEHHFYCYSHLQGPVCGSPVGVVADPVSSFLEEIASLGSGASVAGAGGTGAAGRRLSRVSASVLPRGERRVEFADGLTRRRSSRLAALRRRSRSRSIISRSEENPVREGDEREESDVEELDEEELDEDDLDEEDEEENETGYEGPEDRNRRESDFMRFIRSSRSRSPSVNAFRACKRSQMHRMSLLGRPIHVRPVKHTNPRYRQLQNEMHNFLERPRGWKAMTYHIVM